MARYNEILVGRFARAVQKLFGMKGEVPIGSLAGELTVVHNFLSGVENRYLEAWDLYSAATRIAAVAANQSGFRLRNPASSNVMTVIEKLDVGFSGADSTGFASSGTTNTDLAAVTTIPPLDSRSKRSSSTVYSTQNTTVAIPGLTGEVAIQEWNIAGVGNLQVIFDENQEFPLLPGSAIDVVSGPVNQELTVTIRWRERFLEESERA